MAQGNEKVVLMKGPSSTMPAVKNPGTILVQTDTGYVYLDISEDSDGRIQLSAYKAIYDEDGNKLVDKVDKQDGKDLSSNDYTDADKLKLQGIQAGANKYTHPDTHPASMIVADNLHRFVTDGQIVSWDNKVTSEVGMGLSHNDFTDEYKSKLSNLKSNVVGDWSQNEEYADNFIKNRTHYINSDGIYIQLDPQFIPHDVSVKSADRLTNSILIDGVEFKGDADIMHYGICQTESSVQSKSVEITSFNLVHGAQIYVTFTRGNTSDPFTLNVSGTGAKPVYYQGQPAYSGLINPDQLINLIYNAVDGGRYEVVGSYQDVNTMAIDDGSIDS